MECPDRGELIARMGDRGSRKGRDNKDQEEERVGHLQETLKMAIGIDTGAAQPGANEGERETRRCWRELKVR